jgi:hypothetical protein
MFQTLLDPLNGKVTSAEIWLWWEKRRLAYNLIVIFAALLFLAAYMAACVKILKPGEDFVEPLALIAAMVLGPLAWNACYSLGPILEIVLVKYMPKPMRGPALLKIGLCFSLTLFFLPMLYCLLRICSAH